MSAPLRVSSKAKLADALGISRPTMYQYLRLPDSPPPRNGYYYVSDWRTFVTKKRSVMETSEKQQLQLELLRTKLERENHCLSEARQSTHSKILAELSDQFVSVLQMMRSELFRVRSELAPRFEGLSAREIYSAWTTRERQAFDNVHRELTKRTGASLTEPDTRPIENVVAFDQRRAAGGS